MRLLNSSIILLVNLLGKPDAGDLHVRFDEGDQGNLVPTLPARGLFLLPAPNAVSAKTPTNTAWAAPRVRRPA
jgi:hypothetical protein